MKKSIIISGGSQGIGKALVKKFLENGFQVFTCARNAEKLESLKNEFNHPLLHTFVADLSVKTQCQDFASWVLGQTKTIDILINNAGIGDFGSIEDMPSETWEQVIKTNLFGVYYAAKAVHPFMKSKGEGDIINVASTAGLKGGPNMSAYAASKAAVVSLSQSMMAEWRKQNIRVVTLTPSTIASDMSIQGGLTDGNPEKVLQPEDFAEWVRDILKMNRRALIANGSIFSTNP